MTTWGGSTRHGTARSEIENTIAEIWREVLRVDDVSTDDDFFELGGHSLTASQVISRMERDLRIEVPLVEFFDRPTVAQLAEFVAVARVAGAGPAAEDRRP